MTTLIRQPHYSNHVKQVPNIPYIKNSLRGKIFADFVVLGVISENFIIEISSSPSKYLGCTVAKMYFMTSLIRPPHYSDHVK